KNDEPKLLARGFQKRVEQCLDQTFAEGVSASWTGKRQLQNRSGRLFDPQFVCRLDHRRYLALCAGRFQSGLFPEAKFGKNFCGVLAQGRRVTADWKRFAIE